MDHLLCDQKDTFCYIFISRLFWVSVETLLDLLIRGERKRWKQARQHRKPARFAEWGKNPRQKFGVFACTTVASFGPWSYCSVLCLREKKSTKLLKVIQKSICQLGMHPCLGNCRKKGISGHKVSYIPQHREGNRSMLGAGPKAGHCMALSWQVKCLSHTASVRFAPSSVL